MIEDGYTPPTKLDSEKVVYKPHSEWDEKDFTIVNLNSKAITCIIKGLTCSEFHKVMNITYPKEMQEYLKITHEGTNEIKNSKNNMLTQEFESLLVMPNESMDVFLNRFKDITNNLQSFEKVVTCFDMNNKVLRSLPMEYNSIINPIQIYKDII